MREHIPSFHNLGIRYSIVPRNRAMEVTSSQALDPSHEELWNHLAENGAATQTYVVRINRTGATPDSDTRDPRTPFLRQGTILHEAKLADSEDAATLHIIGAVTGPYAAQPGKNDEWHGMLLITRGEQHVPTFGDLTPTEMTSLHKTIDGTLQYMSRQKGRKGFVGFSFSPLEARRQMSITVPESDSAIDILFPRSPVQNLGTIHGHAVLMNAKYLQTEPVSSPDKFDRRMTREPELDRLVELFQHLVYEPVKTQYPDFPIKYSQHTDNDEIFPKGAFMTINNQHLGEAQMGEFITQLHRRAEQVYQQLASAFVDVEQLRNGRVEMWPKDQIQQNIEELLQQPGFDGLPQTAQRFIRSLINLKDPKDMVTSDMTLKDLSKVVERFVLLGLAYNIVYYRSSRKETTIAIEPRWFSGASPLETLGIFKDQVPVEHDVFDTVMESHKRTGGQVVKHLRRKNIL